ncbi:hypothetical protein LTR12_008779 [Friedmanniomyces endolithicus]|nr:hypothetical protein LTR12_008779 [Friedmanniomyces endolithicus]
MAGNLEELRRLISRERNLVHVRNQWGQSLMHVAAKIHQPAVFNYLLSIGMDEHLQDENQKTAATTVLTRRGSDQYALTLDADDLADRLGWTPLHQAAALARQGFQLTENMVEDGQADINTKDILGRTPLHWLAENGETDALRLLTQSRWGLDLHARDICGFTALHCACWANSVSSAAVLLDAGSDPNARDSHQRPPLHHFDDAELLHLLVQKGADVYIADDEGCNIMHHLAVSDQTALARILLDWYGDSLFVANYAGDTPLALAVQNNSLGVLEVLVPVLRGFSAEIRGSTNRSHRNILHLAALYGSTKMMDLLSTSCLVGVNAAARDKHGHTPHECFLRCRGMHCAVARKPFDLESQSWGALVESARRQNEGSKCEANNEAEAMFVVEEIFDDIFGEDDSDSASESEYGDAREMRFEQNQLALD